MLVGSPSNAIYNNKGYGMTANTAKKLVEWQQKSAANRNETMIGAMIAWQEIGEEKGRGVFALVDIKKGQAILALNQVSYLEDGKPFEYVNSQYVGDRFEFYLENN